mmetsp:Transcript_54939/g.119650  ORF Transcript_54939/g.119650 Transcript_54939/m.119650 type:complete len:458 (-) Transcript_54939:252-1625(-)
MVLTGPPLVHALRLTIADVGIVFSFGNNNFGQLGHFDTAHRSVPTRVRTLFQTMAVRGGCPDPKQRQHSDIIYSCVSQIAAGAFFSLALLETKPNSDPDTTHELWAWGDNHFGQLGCVRTKVTSASDSDGVVVAVSQSYRVICPLSEEKPETAATVHIVKEPLVVDPFGLLGNSKGLRISSIHAGAYHSIILAENGTVYSLGWNGRGQLGWPVNLAGMSSDQPLHVPLSAHDIRKVAVGGFHTSVLLNSGDLYTWGSNYFGQLGLGDRVMRPTPTLMPYWRDENGTTVDRNILDIAAGRHHTYAATTCEGGGFEPAVNGSTTCLCRFGWKGMACSIKCPHVVGAGGISRPCNGVGTFDLENRRPSARDVGYDCNNDGTCVCRGGYKGFDCSIACTPTQDRHFANGISCACQEGWEGDLCDTPVLFGVVQGESLAPLLRPTKHLVLFALSAVFLSLFL